MAFPYGFGVARLLGLPGRPNFEPQVASGARPLGVLPIFLPGCVV